MKTILYIFKMRSKHLITKENISELSLILLNMFAYFFMAKMLCQALNVQKGEMSFEVFFYITNIILFAPILALFLPAFTAKKNILQSYMPINKTTIFFLDFISSFGKRPLLAVLSMTFGFLLFIHSANFIIYVSILLAAANAILLTECIWNILSWKKTIWTLSILLIVLLAILPKWMQYQLNLIVPFQSFSLLILAITCWNSFSTKQPQTTQQKSSFGFKGLTASMLPLKEILMNKTTRKSVLIFMALKIVILFAMPYLGTPYKSASSLDPILLMFFCPILLFATIFNNSFGYFKSLFMSVWLYNNKISGYLSIFAKLLLPLLLIDALISSVFLLVYHLFIWQNVVVYIASILYLILVSIMGSCLTAKKIEEQSLSGMRKNTSTIASLISFAPLYVVLGFHMTNSYFIQIICVGIAFIAFIIFLIKFSKNWQMRVIEALK